MNQSPPGAKQNSVPTYSMESKYNASTRSIIDVIAVIFLDLLAVSFSFFFAFIIRNHILTDLFPAFFTGKMLTHTFELFWWYPLAFIFCLAYEKLYHRRLPFWIEVQWILKAGTLTLFLTIVLLYLMRIGDEVSRLLVLLTWLFAMLAIPFFRYYGKKLFLKFNIWSRPVIIIGNSETIPLIHGAFEREKIMGYKVIGCIMSDGNPGLQDSEPPYDVELKAGLHCLGPLSAAESIIKTSRVDDLIITDSGLTSSELVDLTNRLQPLVKYITLVPDLFGVSVSGLEAAYFFEEQVVMLQIKNRLRSRISSAFKRAFDLVVGLIFNIIALPVMLGIAIAVKLDSRGPAFYISKRIGHCGREFDCLKFRTMYIDADKVLQQYLNNHEEAFKEWILYNKLTNYDPRVTRVGLILRRLSLDELPQLFNILLGEMSLVGPRPYLPREKEQMGIYVNDILVGKPGLTGLWQVSGRNKLTFESRLKLDSWYMKNWSLWLDIVLILKTVRVVMKSDGAY